MTKSTFRTLAVGLALAAIVIVVVMGRSGPDDPAATAPVDARVAEPAAPVPAAVVDAAAAVVDAAVAVLPPMPNKHPIATNTKLNEPQLMTRLRGLKDKNPAAAIELAREGNRRFPDSADAPERSSILIHALAALERPSEARGEAEDMVNHYPDSHWVREVEGFIGAHRRRSVRVNDAGELIVQ